MSEDELKQMLIDAKWTLFQVGSCRTTCEACSEDADAMIKKIDAKLSPDKTFTGENE